MSEAAASRLNDHGELELDLEGVTYVLRPSREAIEAAEKATGRPLLDMAEAARSGRLSLPDICVIVAEFCKAWGREAGPGAAQTQIDAQRFTAAGLGDLLYEAGVLQINRRLAVVLFGAVTGGYDAAGKAKPAWHAALIAPAPVAETPAAA